MWLNLTPHGQAEIKVMWGGEPDWPMPTYTIPAETFRRQVGKVRDALESLSKVYAENSPARTEEMLRVVAKEGHRMRFALLDSDHRVEIEEHLAREFDSPDGTLNVLLGPATCFPVGLCFEGAEGDLNSEDLINSFWTTKFSVGYMLNSLPRKTLSTPLKRNQFRTISAINRDVLAQVNDVLDASQISGINEILDHPVGSAFTSERLDELVETAQASNTLVHFFCHCEDGVLHLSDEDNLDNIDLDMKLDALTGRTYDPQNSTLNLLFLNACETGVTQLDAGFLRLATKDGICGLVTTEARVPTEFAACFGSDFLDRLVLQGQSVGVAMSEMHKVHWPYSLLYSCYAARDFAIEKQYAL